MVDNTIETIESERLGQDRFLNLSKSDTGLFFQFSRKNQNGTYDNVPLSMFAMKKAVDFYNKLKYEGKLSAEKK